MEKYDLVIKSNEVFVGGRLMNCNIGIQNGIITTISKEELKA